MPLRQQDTFLVAPGQKECQVCGRRGVREFNWLHGIGWLCVNKRACSNRKNRDQLQSDYTGMHSL